MAKFYTTWTSTGTGFARRYYAPANAIAGFEVEQHIDGQWRAAFVTRCGVRKELGKHNSIMEAKQACNDFANLEIV